MREDGDGCLVSLGISCNHLTVYLSSDEICSASGYWPCKAMVVVLFLPMHLN